jgi:hypothetical protein
MSDGTEGATSPEEEAQELRAEAAVLEGAAEVLEAEEVVLESEAAVLLAEADELEHHHETFRFTVNGDPFETKRHELTPNDILEIAGLNPALQYLVETAPEDRDFKDHGAEPIKMKHHMEFISLRVGPTPTS